MTQTNKTDERYPRESLETLPEAIPSVFLFYQLKQGRKVDVRLELTGEGSQQLSDDTPLRVEVISQAGDLLMTPIPVNSADLTANFTLPEDIKEGRYILQVTYYNWVLESTTFDVVDEASARQMEEFDAGLEVQDQVTQAIEERKYAEALNLQKEAAKHFVNANNLELAASSWEDLADSLYDKNELAFTKQALQEALEIYSQIEELENGEEILTRIRVEIKSLDKATLTQIQFLRENKGYSQAQLAALVGVTPEIIEDWEQGKEVKKLKHFFELAESLNCKVDDLMEIKSSLNRKIKLNIASLREEQQYNPAQLAGLVGVKPEIIQQWEAGKGLKELLQYFELAQELDCKVSDLIESVDGMIKPKLAELSDKPTSHSPQNLTIT